MDRSDLYRVISLIILYLLVGSGIYSIFFILPENAVGFTEYRILFFHLPSSIISFLSFTITLIASVLYLYKRDERWDDVALASARIGIIFITIAIVTGAIFSNVEWGRPWNWDPKQTTTLILWFVYAAYLSLRSSIENPEVRARTSAILGIFGYFTIPLTYFSTRITTSLHPSGSATLTPLMGEVLLLILCGFLLLYYHLLAYQIHLIRLSRLSEVREE
ncbi:MAG TPA: cytochrome C assembly protein [Candidatus Syntrophoarchaeum butanivorans]|uniref:Cytochrome C assembly protein n=1 Tax=Candidatus Syntropharchaeum butanivorans TaxID=1839936 RepID=A0A7J2S4D7_9EURY|nr:MAG: cytochrome C assembly protein [Candidatus Syntrophoarchaeum sp. WYZ-LMO15]HEC57634.1 cytochrome C assembly protein [Candidatus Syntrophoarchaeum butanivorans]